MKMLIPLILCLGASACAPPAPPAPPATTAPAPFKLAGLPLTLEVKQRTTTAIPGADNQLSLTIDDITADQVMVSLLEKDGNALFGPRSLRAGDAAPFRFRDAPYVLKLDKLSNVLIGDDAATFVVSEPTTTTLSERQKIDQLISTIEGLRGATFVRNGQQYSAKEAAEHLRTKLAAAGDEITTARQFVDRLATLSSLTGMPYTIQFQGGTAVPAGEFLAQELAKLEAPAAQRVLKP